ncbi:band 4.1-like protein 4 [Watersipora subatra]|uniref:band 4.1-like protein 4 n=1 Tax=Watersipora subatra TaxID=2589382 RepID=UPI00355C6F09
MNCFGRFPIKNAPYCCTVELLDGSELKLYVKEEDCGSVLLQKVWDRLNLFERDYFSLRFVNSSNKTWFWIDAQKNIQKQLKRHGIRERHPKFYFGVKFYALDPCSLREEITRYQFFLELRRDVAGGRLPLSFNLRAELGALAAQSELGDYNRKVHRPGYLHALNLTTDDLPDDLQSAITEIHKRKLKGMLPFQCELMYLDIIRKQDIYGVELYNVKGSAGAEYKIGPSPHGIVVYRGKHRAALYHWPRIDLINFKSKELILHVKDKYGNETTNQSFTCATNRICKQLWKSCVEHHSFFRLAAKQESADKSKLFQLGSKYKFTGRTETEIASVSMRTDQPVVNRPLSRRLSCRREANNGTYVSEWIGGSKVGDQQPGQSMFASANNSPASVRSLKLKFHPKPSDDEGLSRRHASRNSRSHSSNRDCTTRKQSGRRSESAERYTGGALKNQRQTDINAELDKQSSISRIVRSYMPNDRASFFDRDVRRHSDRTPLKKREYENIVYNEEGLPVILATHKGEKSDEKMPFYQQKWLQRTLQSRSRSKDKTSVSDKARETIPNSDYVNDPLMESILRPPAKDDTTKPRQGFHEEKLISRDSGTDSPTYASYDEQNVNDFIQKLDKDRNNLTNGEQTEQMEGFTRLVPAAACNRQPGVRTITRVAML